MGQSIYANIIPQGAPSVLYLSQGDVGREFTITIASPDGYNIPTGATAKIEATKPSGFGFSEGGTISGNVISFTSSEGMTDEAGMFPAEVEITLNDDVLISANILVKVKERAHPNGTIDGQEGSIVPELTLLVERVEAAAASVLDMVVTTITLPAGSQATYSYDSSTNTATFGIPEGEAGAGAAGVVANAYSASKTYAVGDYVLHNSNLYRCTTAITTAEAFTAAHWTQIVLADDVTDLKSEITNGGVAQGSQGLVSDSKISDSVPYVFRQTADGTRVGNVLYEEIVGGTVAWNQLCNSSSVTVQSGHKYYLLKGGVTSIGSSSGSAITGLTSGADMVIDLTQMFGSIIADYIYSLETATAGAGVAWFKKLFNKPYYAYNAGELKSISGLVSHDMTGFNQWDEEWEVGSLSVANGEPTVANDFIRSKNFCKCLPDTNYFIRTDNYTKNLLVLWYDADKTYISYSTGHPSTPVTTPSNAYYFKVRSNNGGDYTSYQGNWCINLAWDNTRNGEYKPYVKHSYPLDSTLTLRGIPKLDADNKLYYDGDTYESDDTVTRRYDVVDLGTLAWNYQSGGQGRFDAALSGAKTPSAGNILGSCICSKYVTKLADSIYSGDLGIALVNGHVWVHDANYGTSASSFKTAMSGVYLVYELVTPTTETAEPYTSPQIVDRYGTEEYVTTGIVPVGHNSKYSEDLKGKLEELPWDFSTLIAPTETAYKATRNYTTGGLLIVNNILYKVTANIANGGTITPNTNVTATTLAEVIANL